MLSVPKLFRPGLLLRLSRSEVNEEDVAGDSQGASRGDGGSERALPLGGRSRRLLDGRDDERSIDGEFSP